MPHCPSTDRTVSWETPKATARSRGCGYAGRGGTVGIVEDQLLWAPAGVRPQSAKRLLDGDRPWVATADLPAGGQGFRGIAATSRSDHGHRCVGDAWANFVAPVSRPA